jgi:Tol biopolymer transport system component
VQASLNAYEYVKIEQLDSTHYLTYLDWTPDGQSLIYAIQGDGISKEGKDWIWWQFNLVTREKSSLLPPKSEIIETTRQSLGLCPLANDESTDIALCPAYSILIESPVSDQIVFSPLAYREETWLSNKDGSNSQKLDIPGSPVYVDWSGDGRWLIIGIGSFGLPGQRLYFLVSSDGSVMERFDQLTGRYSLHVSGLFPKFSPDGTLLAYVGAQNPETYVESDYKLYSLDLDSFESKLISDRFGPFQWAENGSGLYVLEKGVFPVTDNPLDFDARYATLYYVNLAQEKLQESELTRNILYYPKNNSSAWLWSYSPSSNAIAYVGLQPGEELGVLLLNSSE